MGARDEIAKIAKMTLSERIEAARAKTAKVVDHLSYLIKLHENNVLILSPLLRSQIPTSHAANAFIVFQHGVFQFEIVRLCALWDGIDLDKENVPTIIKMINQSDVVDALCRRILFILARSTRQKIPSAASKEGALRSDYHEQWGEPRRD